MTYIPNLFDDHENEDFKRFKAYDEENPDVYQFFRQYALKSIERGYKRLSAEFIFNVIRWETPIRANGGEDFKINNNFKPWYSRKFIREFPQYHGFFEQRRSKADQSFTA